MGSQHLVSIQNHHTHELIPIELVTKMLLWYAVRRFHYFYFHALNMAPVFIPSRLQDAGGFQHYRPDIRWDEWCIHGAGLLQQLHCLQAAQGFLPKPAHQVRAEAKEFLCVSNRGSVSLTMCIFPAHWPYLLCTIIPPSPQSLFIMTFHSLCSQRAFPAALWQQAHSPICCCSLWNMRCYQEQKTLGRRN